MKIDIDENTKICLVSEIGDLALDRIYLVREKIEPYLNDLSIRGVIIDMSSTKLIDSQGFTVLVFIIKELKKRDAHFSLFAVPEHTIYLMKMLSFDKIVPIYDSIEEAMASISQLN